MCLSTITQFATRSVSDVCLCERKRNELEGSNLEYGHYTKILDHLLEQNPSTGQSKLSYLCAKYEKAQPVALLIFFS